MSLADDLRIENLKGAITLGVEALKTTILLNGGAAIAVLTFYGNIAKDGTHLPINRFCLRLTLASFAFGTLLAGISFLMAYLSQLYSGTDPDDGDSKVHDRTERRLRTSAVCIGAGSLIAFGVGLIFAIQAFG
jgi:hypothetical protein